MFSTLFRWDDVTVVDGNGRGRDDKVEKIILMLAWLQFYLILQD